MQKTLTDDSAQHATEHTWTCVTCGQEATENFCAHCGEKPLANHDFSLSHVLAEAAEAFFHVDSKVFLTLKTLIKKPGQLTADFFLGRRKPYMSPLQTFFVCNLLFFVLQPLTGLEILAPPLRVFESNVFLKSTAANLIDQRLAKKHISRANEEQFGEFADRFDHISHLQAKSLILVLALMMACVVAVLHFRRHYFSEHIIFALHVYAWWLLWLLAILIVTELAIVISSIVRHRIDFGFIDEAATLLEFGGLGVYLFVANQRYYKDKLVPGIIRGVILMFCGYGLFNLYRLLLLFTVLYST
ncbi:MAG TPA: DUF3667 domain-containing protein [Candidatus Angelobacter sp.]|jgi:hypothetical protein|nr:DUF3667 domain-containing protein [Candidatus Angelobacter sp.]